MFYEFIYLFNLYLDIYFVLGVNLGIGDIVENKNDEVLFLWS